MPPMRRTISEVVFFFFSPPLLSQLMVLLTIELKTILQVILAWFEHYVTSQSQSRLGGVEFHKLFSSVSVTHNTQVLQSYNMQYRVYKKNDTFIK